MIKGKILVIFTGSMDIGGIERSLLGLLDAIDYTQYKVDLFLYGHHGVLFPYINSNVNVLPEVKELAYLKESFQTKLKHGCFYSAFLRIRDEIVSKFKTVDTNMTWASIIKKYAPILETEYDLAISFFRPFDFLHTKVKAKRKVGWIHTDYSTIKSNLNVDNLTNDYRSLDYIAGVSQDVCRSFLNICPEFEERVKVVENILSPESIWAQAKLEDVSSEMDNNCIKLLTVGRYGEAKNMDNIPDICRIIRESGLNIKWYIIGYGGGESLIKQKISEAGMDNNVILLGKKSNPYPYMLDCDLYVQPSRYEGKCVAVREAQILCKPVVITNFATSASQLEDGKDGIVVPMDNLGCAKGIIDLLNDKKLITFLEQTCSSRDYSNRSEINKVYNLTN